MCARVFTTVAATLLGIALPFATAVAAPGSACEPRASIYRRVADRVFRGPEVPEIYTVMHLTEEDQARIRAIAGDESVPPVERMRAALDAYLTARLRHLDPAVRESYVRYIEHFTKKSIYANERGALSANAGYIDIPQELQHTVATYAIIAHEVEHRIQHLDADLMTGPGSSSRQFAFVLRMLFLPSERYFTEHGAIRAEWEFLHQVPEHIRRQAIGLAHSSLRNQSNRQLIERMLGNAGLPFDQYLAREHSHRRYNYGNTVGVAVAAHILITGSVLTVLASTGYLVGCNVCAEEAQTQAEAQVRAGTWDGRLHYGDYCQAFCTQ